MDWDKVITTEQEYKKALGWLSKIFEANPGSPEGREAELPVTLIEKYEKEHYPVALPDPVEAIKETMARKGLKNNDLITGIGSKSGVSLLLNRKRPLTIDMVRNLSRSLGRPVKLLAQPYELDGSNHRKARAQKLKWLLDQM